MDITTVCPPTDRMDALVDLCLARMPAGLTSPADSLRHRRTAARLPITFSELVGFETYIDRPTPVMGMALTTRVASAGWRYLCGDGAGEPSSPDHPVWRRLQDFCRWAEGAASGAAAQTGGIWSEFDVDAEQNLVPDIFIDVQETPLQGPGAVATVQQMAQRLLADDLTSIHAPLIRTLEAIERGGVVFLGFMLARPQPGVRLVISQAGGMEQIYRYLAAVDWPGSLEKLARATAWLDEGAAHCVLQVDVATEVKPRLSIELHSKLEPFDRAGWGALLQRFADRGLCCPEKATALTTFPGGTQEVWGLPFHLIRQVNHLKIVYEEGRPMRAKGYFYFMPSAQPTALADLLMQGVVHFQGGN